MDNIAKVLPSKNYAPSRLDNTPQKTIIKSVQPDIISQRVARHKEHMDIDVLARTIWGEARGEGFNGMNAVACVIYNRYLISQSHRGYWWGGTIPDICKKAYQFSCWNAGDPNRIKMQLVQPDDPEFASAKRIASRILRAYTYADVTYGADHYHHRSIHPNWADSNKIVAEIGSHIFYKLYTGTRGKQ